ncbi:carbamoyltransferase C-terminal domain-containing protein [Streptomyces sp. NPDC002092]
MSFPDALSPRIKRREPLRPFAPVILADHAGTWFDLNLTSPLMLLGPRPSAPDKIAGVVHVDGTALVQTVGPAAAPAYGALGALIEHFHQLTAVPLALNTSFNDREPTFETPAHAFAAFQACDLDAARWLVELGDPDEPQPLKQPNCPCRSASPAVRDCNAARSCPSSAGGRGTEHDDRLIERIFAGGTGRCDPPWMSPAM